MSNVIVVAERPDIPMHRVLHKSRRRRHERGALDRFLDSLDRHVTWNNRTRIRVGHGRHAQEIVVDRSPSRDGHHLHHHHHSPSRIHGWFTEFMGRIFMDRRMRREGRDEAREASIVHEAREAVERDDWNHRRRGWGWFGGRRRHHSHENGSVVVVGDSGTSHHHSNGDGAITVIGGSSSHHGGTRFLEGGTYDVAEYGHYHHHRHPWMHFDHRCHSPYHGGWHRFLGWLMRHPGHRARGRTMGDLARVERSRERKRRRHEMRMNIAAIRGARTIVVG